MITPSHRPRFSRSTSLTTALLVVGLGACVDANAPEEDPHGCADGKCDDDTTAIPRCTALTGTGVDTVIYPAAGQPRTFLYLPDRFVVTRIASHAPAFNLGTLSESEQRRSPYVASPSVQFEISLAAADSESELRAAVRAALPELTGTIEIMPVSLRTAAVDPLALIVASPDVDPTMSSRRTGALSYVVEARLPAVPADGSALVALLEMLHHRAGLVSATLPAKLTCLDADGVEVSRNITTQSSRLTLATDGIEMSNGPEVVEAVANVLRTWNNLTGLTEWTATLGHPFDLSAYVARSRSELLMAVGFGDETVTVADVHASAAAVQTEIRAAYAVVLSSFDASTPDVMAHLANVAAGGPRLTPLDAAFADVIQATEPLATFAPATIEVIEFVD